MLPAHELIGEGPPLVLIPGTLSDRRSWGKQVGALSARHRCLLFDPRGTGAAADDALAGLEQPRAITAAITGARFELIERSGHSPHIERASNFNKLVAEFLAH